eukprot:gene25351-30612_t
MKIAVGIDLGTTFSVIGANIDGKVVIFSDRQGRRIFPSIVSYLDNGEILVGYEALAKQSAYPQNTIYNAKRFIGKSLEEEETQAYAAEHPFTVVSSTRSNYSKVGFLINATGHFLPAPFTVTPEEVGVQVLTHLVHVGGGYLGYGRGASMEAGWGKGGETGVDMGAGMQGLVDSAVGSRKGLFAKLATTAWTYLHPYLQRSALYKDKLWGIYTSKLGSVQVYATDGDETLGGSDVDLCMYKILHRKVETALGRPLADEPTVSSSQKTASLYPPCSPPSLHMQAEEVKKQLSTYMQVDVYCSLAGDVASDTAGHSAGSAGNGGVVGIAHGVGDDSEDSYLADHGVVRVRMHRSDLEEGCVHIFQRALDPLSRLLDTTNMQTSDIDDVVCVGGSTRIPHIKSLLNSYFNKTVYDSIDPDITVAYGAASIID